MIPKGGCVLSTLLLLAALAAGCKKHDPEASVGAASNAAPAAPSVLAAAVVRSPGAPMPTPYAPGTIATPENSDMTATLQQLSLELRKYVVSTRSVPKNFEEFVAKSQVQIPPAPAGQKYKIQGQAVVLVKR
jgi:hypothetical protein